MFPTPFLPFFEPHIYEFIMCLSYCPAHIPLFFVLFYKHATGSTELFAVVATKCAQAHKNSIKLFKAKENAAKQRHDDGSADVNLIKCCNIFQNPTKIYNTRKRIKSKGPTFKLVARIFGGNFLSPKEVKGG